MLAECNRNSLKNYIINLEVTNKCNLNCFFCRAEANKHLENELTKENIYDLFKDLKKMGVSHISITGGEPLVRKDLPEIIDIGSKMGFKFSISTNGTLIKTVPISMLKKIKQIRISLDAARAELHNKMRGSKDAFKKTIEGVAYLVSHNIFPLLRFTAHRGNSMEVLPFIKLASGLKIKVIKINRIIPILGCVFNAKEQLTPKEYKTVLVRASNVAKKYGIELSSDHPITFKLFKNVKNCKFGGCAAGIVHIHINSRGEIFPCQYLPIRLGSIRKDKIYN